MAKTFQDLLNEGQAKVLGIVSIVPMDDWNADTQYQKLNLVRHNGATYLAKGGNKNVEPGAAADWQNSWMLVYLDGILSPDGTYPNLTAGRVMHALAWGNKNYDGSSAQTITAADLGLADVYKPQGSIAYSALPATPSASNYGYVWNITNDFTTDSRFIEGAGKKYSAGTNVGVIEQDSAYYYDIFGAFIDLSNYATVEALNSEITRAKAAEQANAIAASKAQSTANSKYTKPSSGIPKSDLAQSVQDSLDKADSALQSAPVTSVNGETGAVSLSASDVGAATSAQGTKADQAATDIANIKEGTTVVGKAGTAEIANRTGSIVIQNNADLNDCTANINEVQVYTCQTNATAATLLNCPVDITFTMWTTCAFEELSNGSRDFQFLIAINSKCYYRVRRGGTTWDNWRTLVESDGSYKTLGAGHLQDIVVNVNTTATGWVKFASIKNSIASGTASIAVDFNVLAITTDNFRGGREGSGKIEAEVRISNGTTITAGLSVLGGNINPEYFCIVPTSISADNPGGADLYVNCEQMYASYKITLLSSGSNYQREFEIELKNETPVTSAPSGAVYAVNSNVAAKGVTPATSSNSDDVATTEWVNDKIPAVPAVPNLNGSTSYSGTYYAAKSLPGNGTFLVGTGTTSSPISGVNLNSRSGFTEADYISFGSATSGNGTLESYTAHAYLGIRWTKTNSSGEQYITAYWIPTILLVNGDADHYFCVTDSEDFVNFWFSSNTRFNYVSSKISSMRVSLYDYNT